jgi:hypothetical protein
MSNYVKERQVGFMDDSPVITSSQSPLPVTRSSNNRSHRYHRRQQQQQQQQQMIENIIPIVPFFMSSGVYPRHSNNSILIHISPRGMLIPHMRIFNGADVMYESLLALDDTIKKEGVSERDLKRYLKRSSSINHRGKSCNICLDDFKRNDRISEIVLCKHSFQ